MWSVEEMLLDDDTSEREAVSVLRARSTWKEWLLHDFLRYWYGVGAMAFVVLLTISVAQELHVRDALGVFALAVLAVLVIIGEVLLYNAIWPQGPFTEGWPIAKRVRRLWQRIKWH